MIKKEIHVRYKEAVHDSNETVEKHLIINVDVDPLTSTHKLLFAQEYLEDLIAIGRAQGLDIEFTDANQATEEEKSHGFDVCEACKGTGDRDGIMHEHEWNACPACGGAGIKLDGKRIERDETPLVETSEVMMQEITSQLSLEARYPYSETSYVQIHFNGKMRTVPCVMKYEDFVMLAGYKDDKVLSIAWMRREGQSEAAKSVLPGESIELKSGDYVDAGDTSNA